MEDARPALDLLDGVTARIVHQETGYGWAEPVADSPLPEPAGDDVLRVEHLAKRFAGVAPLRDVNLRLRRGEALGVVGGNGSGKSTLINVLSGLAAPDAGTLAIWGVPLALAGVEHARALGLECVHQDLGLVEPMPVWQNLFLHRELVHRPVPFLARRRMRAEARRKLAVLGIDLVSVDVPVARLSGGERQAVAVARIVGSQARILLLDEPTAAMGVRQSAAILDVLARLRELHDVSIVLVGHNLAQVLTFCDRVNVLEDGHIALDEPVDDVRLDQLVRTHRAGHPTKQRDGAAAQAVK